LLALLIGAAVGSFLNMVIYRLPRRLSFVDPPKSFCPKCKHPLGWVDLFPLLSWLSTGGKCRYCKAPIAVRYFLVEVFCGALFSALWWQYLIADYQPLRMAFYMATTACLVAIIFIDWELYIIPDEINALLLVIGVGLQACLGRLDVALWGALAGWGILWGIAFLGRILFRKDAMGHGDIKMMRGVGAIIGPTLLLANMAMAVVAGLVIGIAMILLVKKAPEAAPKEEPVAEAEAYFVEISLSPAEIQEFKAACAESETPWASLAMAAKGASIKDARSLIAALGPESISSLLRFGVFYLLCLDIVALFWHGAYGLIGETYVEENVEDDTWSPSLTTIPFGPYLAVGTLACLIFAAPIEAGIRAYWDTATGVNQAVGPKMSPLSAPQLRRFEGFASLTRVKGAQTSLDLASLMEPSGAVELTPKGTAFCLQNWNNLEKLPVQPSGESGAYCA
jgi:leader peptidase (prepilin peptidase)/N-methyltransferase